MTSMATRLYEALSASEQYQHLLPPGSREPVWQDSALCAQTDPESFFPEKGGTTAPAKKVCLGCEVRKECLDYALEHEERFGIWGGFSERERRRLKRGIDVTPTTGTGNQHTRGAA